MKIASLTTGQVLQRAVNLAVANKVRLVRSEVYEATE